MEKIPFARSGLDNVNAAGCAWAPRPTYSESADAAISADADLAFIADFIFITFWAELCALGSNAEMGQITLTALRPTRTRVAPVGRPCTV